MQTLAFIITDRDSPGLGQGDQARGQVAEVGCSDEETPAGVSRTMPPGIGECQRAGADSRYAGGGLDRAFLGLDQVGQNQMQLGVTTDEAKAG